MLGGFFGARGDLTAELEAGDARRKAGRVESANMALDQRVDRLVLACQAMWELLSERTGVTMEDLAERIVEVDLRDGKRDGKMRTRAIPCPTCGRPANSTRATCMFCGNALPFETVAS